MKICGIYKITSPSGKIYIGQSVDIKTRWRKYKNKLPLSQLRLHNSFAKHGYEKHNFEIIHECSEMDLNKLERYYQDMYNVIGENGLNCILTQTNEKRRIYSEEFKERISKTLKGRTVPKHIVEKIINTRKSMNLKMSDHVKNRLKEGKLANPITIETRKLMSESAKKKKIDKNVYVKIGDKLRGRLMPQYVKDKISKNRKGKYNSPEAKMKYRESRQKPIIDIQTGVFYSGAIELSNLLGISNKKIHRMLSGHNKNNTPYKYA